MSLTAPVRGPPTEERQMNQRVVRRPHPAVQTAAETAATVAVRAPAATEHLRRPAGVGETGGCEQIAIFTGFCRLA